jgi:hypothetical protein
MIVMGGGGGGSGHSLGSAGGGGGGGEVHALQNLHLTPYNEELRGEAATAHHDMVSPKYPQGCEEEEKKFQEGI